MKNVTGEVYIKRREGMWEARSLAGIRIGWRHERLSTLRAWLREQGVVVVPAPAPPADGGARNG